LLAAAASPMTNTSGRLGIERSGTTLTRPLLSASAFSQSATGVALTPALQITALVRIRSPAATTGRTRADQHESEEATTVFFRPRSFGEFQAKQDLAANGDGLFERLETVCAPRPLVITEVTRFGARCDDEVIVREYLPCGLNGAAFGIDADDFIKDDVDIPTASRDSPKRRGDVRGRESTGRDLIQQRLEQVVIVSVNPGDADRLIAQATHSGEPAEPTAENYHTRQSRVGQAMPSLARLRQCHFRRLAAHP
jgi:hypothetical protein